MTHIKAFMYGLKTPSCAIFKQLTVNHAEHTGSRLISEVKLRCLYSLLEWVTALSRSR